MLVNLKDWAELDGPTIVLVIVMMLRDTIREYLRARYGASTPAAKKVNADKEESKE